MIEAGGGRVVVGVYRYKAAAGAVVREEEHFQEVQQGAANAGALDLAAHTKATDLHRRIGVVTTAVGHRLLEPGLDRKRIVHKAHEGDGR